MTEFTSKEDLSSLTLEFLSSLPKRTHMSWIEWQEKAEDYGLNENDIAELKQYLDASNQLTYPAQFGGNRWWLTEKELRHIEEIKKYFGTDWETEVLDRIKRRDLGYLDRDWRLEERKKAKE
jgi:hypothetical protein